MLCFCHFLHVPMHVITGGDARYDWFECNWIKRIKVHPERRLRVVSNLRQAQWGERRTFSGAPLVSRLLAGDYFRASARVRRSPHYPCRKLETPRSLSRARLFKAKLS